MTNITIVNTCAVLWHPLRTLFVGIVPEKKRLHLGANLVRTFCQNNHCPFFIPSPFFPQAVASSCLTKLVVTQLLGTLRIANLRIGY